MPNRDGTGPNSMGSMTGRGLGICADNNDVNLGFGRGRSFGCRHGFGKTFMNDNSASMTQKELLEDQKLVFERSLKVLNEQLEKLR